MTVQEIADRLVELCRKGDHSAAQQELFAQDAESVEPDFTQMPPTKGLDKLTEKGKQFEASVLEFHGGEVSEPLVAGNFISLQMSYDATFKEMGRINMSEICVYEVKDGKIVKEQFFYSQG